jgi:hypothetical protein
MRKAGKKERFDHPLWLTFDPANPSDTTYGTYGVWITLTLTVVRDKFLIRNNSKS